MIEPHCKPGYLDFVIPRLDGVSPGVVEGESSNQHAEEDLDFVDRGSHSNAGLRGWEV